MEELEARWKPHTELRCNCWIPSWELPSIVNHEQELSYMFNPSLASRQWKLLHHQVENSSDFCSFREPWEKAMT